MNREALRHVVGAKQAGWNHVRLAALYDDLRLQIQAAAPGWVADPIRCVDGSLAFVGSKGPALAFCADGRVLVGGCYPGGMLNTDEIQYAASGLLWPAPNPDAPNTKEVP